MVGSFRYIFITCLSFLLGFIFTLWPIPNALSWWRPEFILLLVIFWSLNAPQKVSVGVAWVVGLILDVLGGTLLGEYALVFAVVSYLACKGQPRFHLFPYLQQILFVFGLILIDKVLLFFIQSSVGQAPAFGLYFINVITTLLLWPVVATLLRYYMQKLRLYSTQSRL